MGVLLVLKGFKGLRGSGGKKTHWNGAVTASRKAYNHLCFRFPIDVAHTESNASVDENLEGSSMSDE